MSPLPWRTALLCCVVLFGLCACGGNYRFDDDAYRPLGEPQAIKFGRA